AGGGYVEYLSASVTASMNDATRSFSLELSDRDRGLYPGTPVKIFGDSGQLLIDGYVNGYTASFDATSHRISVSGRGKGQDAIDCSCDHSTGQFKNKTAVEICNEICAASGIESKYLDNIGLPKIAQFHINQGETVHQVARRLSRNYAATIMGAADGVMVWTTAENASHGGLLKEGVFPLLSASVNLDDSREFSDFKFRSQLAGREEKYGAEASQSQAVVGGEHRRTRPHIEIVDKSQDQAQSKERADWQARRIQAGSKAISAEIVGDSVGAPVEPNMKIFVDSAWLGVNQEMLIESCTWTTDSNGTRTGLKLVPPEAFKGKSSSASTKGAMTADGGMRSPVTGATPKSKPTTPSISPSEPAYGTLARTGNAE
ncbi:MAG: hypothetical protein VYA18_07415, partial [Pseudomonadota bacterium]|nr:hypothetical protein [Pseudomonadota bacterium]